MRVRSPRSARFTAPLAALTGCAVLLPLLGVLAPPAAAAERGPVLIPGARVVLLAGSTEARTVVPARTRSALRASGARATAAGSVFQVTYTGFTVTQRDAFQRAVDTWERLVTSSVPIRIDARLSPLPDAVLGSAGPTNLVVDDADGRNGPDDTLQAVALANAEAGRDLDPDGPDISADFSNDTTLFSYGDQPVAGRYDFTTVVLHEIAHGLGFAGAMDVLPGATGTRRGYWDPGTSQPHPLSYDRHTVSLAADGTATPLLTIPRGSVALAKALTSRTAWDGAAGRAANGGVRPLLYAPARWDVGSSYSHLDEDAFPTGDPDSLMTPVLDLAEVVRDPGRVALGMLADIGWGSDTSALRVAGSQSVRVGAPLTVTGAAPVSSSVQLLVHRRGSTTTTPGALPGYALERTLAVGAAGRFAATLTASDDLRYYVQTVPSTQAAVSSQGALTQVRPVVAGPATRVVRRGTTVVLSGRGQPSSTLRLRFTRGSAVDVTRYVAVRADGTWSRSQVLTADLLVSARGANGQLADTGALLQAR